MQVDGRTASKPAEPVEGETHLPAGRFGKVTVYIPEGTPNSVAIFLSGDGGWNLGVISMAKALVDMGAVVIGVLLVDCSHRVVPAYVVGSRSVLPAVWAKLRTRVEPDSPRGPYD